MKNQTKLLVFCATLGLLSLQQAKATVIGVDLGTANPPATLGGYNMTAFDPGTIAGENYTADEINGNGYDGWLTWGQNYTGKVHVSFGATPLTLTLSGVSAVDFYEEPNQFSNFYMTAKDSSGATVTTLINGYHGSSGVGFYETVAGDYLSSITVTCTDPTGFAIGEFAKNGGTVTGSIGQVPDGGSTLMLLGGVFAGLAGLRRRFSK